MIYPDPSKGSSAASIKGRAMPIPQVIIEEWKPRQQSTLLGFVTVLLPSGMRLHDVSVHMKSGKAWASPASKPQIDRNGLVVTSVPKVPI